MTRVYLAAGRSILSALLLLFVVNFTSQLLAPITDRSEILRSVLILAIGLLACLLVERRLRLPGRTPGARSRP